jgi:hypothetical protein
LAINTSFSDGLSLIEGQNFFPSVLLPSMLLLEVPFRLLVLFLTSLLFELAFLSTQSFLDTGFTASALASGTGFDPFCSNLPAGAFFDPLLYSSPPVDTIFLEKQLKRK